MGLTRKRRVFIEKVLSGRLPFAGQLVVLRLIAGRAGDHNVLRVIRAPATEGNDMLNMVNLVEWSGAPIAQPVLKCIFSLHILNGAISWGMASAGSVADSLHSIAKSAPWRIIVLARMAQTSLMVFVVGTAAVFTCPFTVGPLPSKALTEHCVFVGYISRMAAFFTTRLQAIRRCCLLAESIVREYALAHAAFLN